MFIFEFSLIKFVNIVTCEILRSLTIIIDVQKISIFFDKETEQVLVYSEQIFLGKEAADLNALNVQLNETLAQLKNLKANYVYTANELDHLREQGEVLEKDLDEVSRFR